MEPPNLNTSLKAYLSSRGLTKPDPHHYRNQFYKLIASRRITEFFLITLLQYVGLSLGHLNGTNVPIWPASGVALAMLFLRGNRALFGLFVGSVLAYSQAELANIVIILAATLHTLDILLIRWAALKWIGPIKPLQHTKTFWQFILLLIPITFVFTLMLWWLLTKGPDKFYGFWSSWRQAWAGEIIGILTFTPLCLIWDTYVPKRFPQNFLKTNFSTILLLFGGLFFINASCFVVKTPTVILSLFGLSIILQGLISYHFGQFGATLGTVLAATLFLCGANANLSLFIEPLSGIPFWVIQTKMAFEALLSFTVASRMRPF